MQALVIQHVEIEGVGLLGEIFYNLGWKMDMRQMYRPGISLPGNLENHDALVILGGPMGADDDTAYPYLTEVKNLIRLAVKQYIPTVGFCLGGQLIARALGAKVLPNAATEIGWYPLRLTSLGCREVLFEGLPDEFMVFQWHNDTFEIPEGAFHLASSETCRNQAFSYQEKVWALQFHLEVTPEMIKTWIEAYADELTKADGDQAIKKLLQQTEQLWPQQQKYSKQFLSNLGGLIEGSLV